MEKRKNWKTKEEYKVQEERIKKFDEAILSNIDFMKSGKLSFWLYAIVEIILFVNPIERDGDSMIKMGIWVLMWAILSITSYMQDYLVIAEQKRQCPIWRKCRFLPVERSVFIRTRFRYLWNVLWKVVLASVLVQTIAMVLIRGTLTIESILYPILVAGVIPFLVNAGYIYWSTR